MTDQMHNQPPPGWTWAGFKAASMETGQWVWGTVQGSFNDKMSTSQVITDAVIGCIPLLGDATAVRDLIAVSIGLSDDPKKREDVWEWALLGVMVLALIPVLGGVLKGVGKLVIRFAKAVGKLQGAARAAKVAEAAKSIIRVLNHFKFIGNAEKWLLNLRFADYQGKMIEALDTFTGRVDGALQAIKNKMGDVLPNVMLDRIAALRHSMQWLRTEFRKRIPEAIVKLDEALRELQGYIRSGGETTSKTVTHEAVSGETRVTYAQEERLLENGPLPVRSARGGWKQNPANSNDLDEIEQYYKHEQGYPDLMARPDKYTGHVSAIAAFSGKIVNRPLRDGEGAFRVFGPKRMTYGAKVRDTHPNGFWWGLGEAPHTAEKWRENAAVLDEFNGDGYVVVARVREGDRLKSCVGHIAEQTGKDIPGQYLPGSGSLEQAFVKMPDETNLFLKKAGKRVISGKDSVVRWSDRASGLNFEVRPTGWDDANGIWGYDDLPDPREARTQPLGSQEIADKKYKDNAP